MNDEMRKVINDFKETNGNDKFTNKDLIIYFNKMHSNRIDSLENKISRLEEKIDKLPCFQHANRILKIETTNKVLVFIFGLSITLIGLLVAILKTG